mgnify:CR=1 FL=1
MHERIGAILTTATLLSGCNALYDEPYEWKPTKIRADQLPEELPDRVADQIPNVMAMTNETRGYAGLYDHYITTDLCSGVRIDKYDYLSAGHCVDPSDIPYGIQPYCEEIRIDIPFGDQDAVTLNGTTIAGYAPNTSILNDRQFLDQKDVLLVHVDDSDPDSQPLYDNPTVILENSERIQPGTPLYFINYQPTKNHEYRNPNINSIPVPEVTRGPSTPAILGAIAIRYINSDTIEAITVGKSYGESIDNGVRQGGSGGPIYDGEGNLVATLTAISHNAVSLKKFENDRAIDITGMPDDSQVTATYIKTVSHDTIEELRAYPQTITGCN